MRNLFTLIELIVVIVILGILAAIVIPNINNWQKESEVTALSGNIKNMQTSVDMFSLKNVGLLPTEHEPLPLTPYPIDFNQISPLYIRDLPKIKGAKYWLDFRGKVWASTVDAPKQVYFEGNTVTWEKVKDAKSYNVYEVLNYNGVVGKSNFQNVVFKLVHETGGNLPPEESTLSFSSPKLTGKNYAVSAIDDNDFETPPVGNGYLGYNEIPIEEKTPENEVPEVEEPIESRDNYSKFRPISIINSGDWTKAFDKDLSSYRRIRGPYNHQYLYWSGDLSNRIVNIKMGSTSGIFYMNDKDGNHIPFIDAKTDRVIKEWEFKFGDPTVTKNFVIPPGVTTFDFYALNTGLTDNQLDVYEIMLEDDATGTLPVKNIKGNSPNHHNITLTWDNPNPSSSKFAVYREDVFIDYTNTNSYSDNSLYASTTYDYEIQTINAVGNRSEKVPFSYTTSSTEIEWGGLADAKAFDEDLTTNYYMYKTTEYVTWKGDLSNKTIQLDLYSTRGRFQMLDSNDQPIIFKDTSGRSYEYWEVSDNRLTKKFIVPSNVVKFKFSLISTGFSGQNIKIYNLDLAK